MAPRLSVVVPFHNVADYLGPCLDSLSRQTFDDIDVILVDDGSRDRSADVALRFCQRDRRFRLVRQENQGPGPARNTGIQQCEGEYLAFVDGDDLVPHDAFEMMVRSLDETGSSFVAGNARRFNSLGVRESWSHRIPFVRDRLATHIIEFPSLALDRMVWNKVYRRSFWDKVGYQFLPIWYEDYPVVLQAHIEAAAVDCLAAPVYYWRERESGQSVTQHKFEYANLVDRAVSAELVMDLVNERAPVLRGQVHRILAEIDLTAFVQAFASLPGDQHPALVQLGQRLTRRLDGRVLPELSAYDRLQYHALAAGDADLLRRLGQFRLDGGLRGSGRARRRLATPWHWEHQYPGLHDRPRSVPRRLYRLPADGFTARTTVSRVAWAESALIIRGTAHIRHIRSDRRSTVAMFLVSAGSTTPIPVERFEAVDTHGDRALVGFEARLSRESLAALPAAEEYAHIEVELATGRLRRRGVLSGLHAGNPQWAPGAWVGDGVWIQPGRYRHERLLLRRLANPGLVTNVDIDDDAFVLSGVLPADSSDPSLRLARPSGRSLAVRLDRCQHASGMGFTVRIPMAAIGNATHVDDPFADIATWELGLVDGERERVLLAGGLGRAVSAVYQRRLLTVTRSQANDTVLRDGPVRPVCDSVSVESIGRRRRLVVHGHQWDRAGYRFAWRRTLPRTTGHVDLPCQVAVAGDRWSAAVDISGLVPSSGLLRRPADPLAHLVTCAFVVVPAGHPPFAAQPEAFLSGRLPIEFDAGDLHACLEAGDGMLRLGVRGGEGRDRSTGSILS